MRAAPQLIAGLRDERQLSQKIVVFNGKRFGCVYNVKSELSQVPEEFHYRLSTRIRREGASGKTAALYREIAREIKMPRERLERASGNGAGWSVLVRYAAYRSRCGSTQKKRDAHCDLKGIGMGQPHRYPPPRTGIPLYLICSLPLLSFLNVLFQTYKLL